MLDEALTIIKTLWTKTRVTYKGKYWKLSKANLYTKPKTKIPIFVAGTGVKIAYVAGKHADAFITVPHVAVNFDKVLKSLRKGAKDSGRDPDKIKLVLHTMFSYDEDYEKALEATKPWAATVIPALYKYGIYDPVEMDEHAELVGKEVRAKKFTIVTSPDELISKIEPYIKMGFTRFQINNSSPDPPKLIEVIGKYVIPYFRDEYGDKS